MHEFDKAVECRRDDSKSGRLDLGPHLKVRDDKMRGGGRGSLSNGIYK